MPVEGQALVNAISIQEVVVFVFKIGVISIAVLYFIFSLIVVRQVHLMTETLITEVAPFFRAGAIVHAGIALGITILFIGFLFG